MLADSTFFEELPFLQGNRIWCRIRPRPGVVWSPDQGDAVQYMLMIYDNEGEEAALPEEELNAIMVAHSALARKWRDEGRFLAGDRLQSSATATTVRMVDGKIVMTDGPYADTKEQLGGFYIIEADDLDHALADASAIPSVGRTIIEVRPVWT
jgi:hypothetical protein